MRYLRILSLALVSASASLSAQTYTDIVSRYEHGSSITNGSDAGLFNHLDLSLTAGSTGVGFDVAMPAGDYLQVRAGGVFMPRFNYKMKFYVQVGDGENDDYDPNDNDGETRFEKLANLLNSMTGYDVDNRIDMLGVPRMNNFKLMFDVTPFNNKNWHFSVGAYVGKSRFAKAQNTIEDMTSLMAVSIYNNMYHKILAEEPLISYNGMSAYLPSNFTDKVKEYGMMSMPIGEFVHDVVAKEDVLYDYNEIDEITGQIIHQKGDVRVAAGEVLYHAGDVYRMVPDKDNTVKVDAKSNVVKPYVGFGYSGVLPRNERIKLSADLGVMMWGGRPSLITHEGVDLMHDLTNVGGKVGNYVDTAKKFPVFPVLELRASYRIF